MGFEIKLLFVLYIVASFFGDVRGRRVLSLANYNVMSYGAKANGRTDDSKAFLDAWKAACSSVGHVTLDVPAGTYLLGPIQFEGPCRNVQDIEFNMKGTLKATTNLGMYKSDDWIRFAWIENLTLSGGGTFDGQGAVSWPFNKCPINKNCKVLPSSIRFLSMRNTTVDDITSLNSKFFHIVLLGCKNFKASRLKIVAPAKSPNTDGIHMEQNAGVEISNSEIGTGDDCISVGQNNSQVTLTEISCGPGHGISVGSLGRYENEGDVRGLIVKDCTLTGTDNGLRIKTWQNSPQQSAAANMTFENIVMDHVANPILIDQTYCPYANCGAQPPSRVRISDIKFINIRGTTTTPMAVSLKCSSGLPCQNVILRDVSLTHIGGTTTTSMCLNVKPSFSGVQNPPACH